MEEKEPFSESDKVESSLDNPCLEGDESTFVKRSITSTHKPFEKTNKTDRALSKLKAEKEKMQFKDESDIELTLSNINQTPKIDLDSEDETESPAMIHSSNISKLNNQDIMRMTFANDSIAEV